MSDREDKSSKTERPSAYKLEEAKKKGQIFVSKELNAFLSLTTFAVLIAWAGPALGKHAIHAVAKYIEAPHTIISQNNYSADVVSGAVIRLLLDSMGIILLPILMFALIAIVGNVLQHGFIYAPEVLAPKLERISILAGLKRIFSRNALFELCKGLAKITLVGIAIYFTIKPEFPKFNYAYTGEFGCILHLLLDGINKMLITVCIIMFFLGTADYIYQRYNYMTEMMMTKHEMKEEFKQREGSPEIKNKLKSMRMKRARSRMMASVPKADVIITNPTHYAIALKYEIDSMLAPIVLAKGKDLLALEIKRIATEHSIPIIENPVLARALYMSVEVDQTIKYEHYKAVAEVIYYVMKLKGTLLKNAEKELRYVKRQ
ncbi:Flagellar biosynthetic protein FlhB [Alphaproteobacteria bacterium]